MTNLLAPSLPDPGWKGKVRIIGRLDRPNASRVFIGEHEISAASERKPLTPRRNMIGLVFQSFGLVPILSAAENVAVPMRLARVLLELVGPGRACAAPSWTCSARWRRRAG